MNEPKVIGQITISVLEGNQLAIASNFQDQNTVRDILKSAEEVVVREALQKVSQKSNIVQLNTNVN